MAPTDCIYNNEVYPDGTLLKKDIPCEKCYCMKGDIVCAVQECGPTPLDKVNCTALPVKKGQCCPDTYDCGQLSEEDLTTISSYEVTTVQPSVIHKEGTIVFPQDDDEKEDHSTSHSTEKQQTTTDQETEHKVKMTTESITESVTEAITSRVTGIIEAVTTALYGSSEPSEDKHAETLGPSDEAEKPTEVPVPAMDEGSGAEPVTEVPEVLTSSEVSKEATTHPGAETSTEVPEKTVTEVQSEKEEDKSPVRTEAPSPDQSTIITEPELKPTVTDKSSITSTVVQSTKDEEQKSESTEKPEQTEKNLTEENLTEESPVTKVYPISEESPVTERKSDTDESVSSEEPVVTEALPQTKEPVESEVPSKTEPSVITEGQTQTQSPVAPSESEKSPSISEEVSTKEPASTSEEKCEGSDCHTPTQESPQTEEPGTQAHDCEGSECEQHEIPENTEIPEFEKASFKPEEKPELTTSTPVKKEHSTSKPEPELSNEVTTTESDIEIITSAPTKDTEKPPSMDHISENIPSEKEPEPTVTEDSTEVSNVVTIEEKITTPGDVESNEIPIVPEKCTGEECTLQGQEPVDEHNTPEPEDQVAHDCDEDDEECSSNVETPSDETNEGAVAQPCEDGKECAQKPEISETYTTPKSVDKTTPSQSQSSQETTSYDVAPVETEQPPAITTVTKEVSTQKSKEGEEEKEPNVPEHDLEEGSGMYSSSAEPEIPAQSTTKSDIAVPSATDSGVTEEEHEYKETSKEPAITEAPKVQTTEPEVADEHETTMKSVSEMTSSTSIMTGTSEVFKQEPEEETTQEITSATDESHTESIDMYPTRGEGETSSTQKAKIEKGESVTEDITEIPTTQREEKLPTSPQDEKISTEAIVKPESSTLKDIDNEVAPEFTTSKTPDHEYQTTVPTEKLPETSDISSESSTGEIDSEITTAGIPKIVYTERTTSKLPEDEVTSPSTEGESGEPQTTSSSASSDVTEGETAAPVTVSEDTTTREYGIPGEGSCLVDGQTYKNNSSVPPVNQCQVSCKCISSILQCQSVPCKGPPENMQNCIPIFHSPDSCCPTYSCCKLSHENLINISLVTLIDLFIIILCCSRTRSDQYGI